MPEEAVLGLLGPPLLGLLRASARVSAPIRSRALHLLLRTLDAFRDPSPARRARAGTGQAIHLCQMTITLP